MKKQYKSKTIGIAAIQGVIGLAGVLTYLLNVLNNPQFVQTSIEFFGLFNIQVEGVLYLSIVTLMKALLDYAIRKVTKEAIV